MTMVKLSKYKQIWIVFSEQPDGKTTIEGVFSTSQKASHYCSVLKKMRRQTLEKDQVMSDYLYSAEYLDVER